jgi:hypothetical protein
MRNVHRGVATLLGTVVAMVAAVAPAHADAAATASGRLGAAEVTALLSGDSTIAATTWFYLRNVATDRYLEVKNGSTANGAPIVQNYKAPGQQRQAWTLYQSNDGYMVLRSATTASWKAISITGGGITNGVKAIQYTYIEGNLNEKWFVINHGGVLEFINRNSNKCLEIPASNRTPGVQADQWTCIGVDNEMWTLHSWP